jgi:quercetin dioxygenase-like cupin family protein
VGWFVVNARETTWRRRPGRGYSAPLTGLTDEEAQTLFPQLGMQIVVLEPGEPIGMYHWEKDAEGFLVLSGEALLLVEGEERPLRRWDFVHCPPGTKHVIVGAGDGPCVVFAVGALENHTVGSRVDGTLEGRDDWGAYTVDETARRHGAGVDEETTDAKVAYARFSELEPTRYRDGWLP